MSYCNIDGRHKTTETIKKRLFEAPKYAQLLSVRSNFSLEVSICSNIQVFSNPHTLHQQEGAGTGQSIDDTCSQ